MTYIGMVICVCAQGTKFSPSMDSLLQNIIGALAYVITECMLINSLMHVGS